MSLTPPTDAELDVMIRARLASIGIDLDQLPEGTAPDPATGSPGRESALASLRSFVRSTLADISAFRLPTPNGLPDEGPDAAALAQQLYQLHVLSAAVGLPETGSESCHDGPGERSAICFHDSTVGGEHIGIFPQGHYIRLYLPVRCWPKRAECCFHTC